MPAEEPEVKAPAEEIEENPVLEDMPVLTVRDTVIYPGALLPITVGRPSSLALVQSLGENRTLAVISQLDPRVESPGPGDLYAPLLAKAPPDWEKKNMEAVIETQVIQGHSGPPNVLAVETW